MRRTSALLLLCGTTLAHASVTPTLKKALQVQRQQPVTLNADRAEWRKDGVMIYEGHVRLVSGTLRLEGSRVEVQTVPRDRLRAQVSGTPARLVHAALAASPEVSAESQSLVLDSNEGMVQLSGDARLVRGAETLSGDSIRYDVIGRRIRAAGSTRGGGRVRLEVPSANLAPAPQPAARDNAPVKPPQTP